MDILEEIRETQRNLTHLIRRARKQNFKWTAIAWALDIDVKTALELYAKVDPPPRQTRMRPHRDPS